MERLSSEQGLEIGGATIHGLETGGETRRYVVGI